MQTLVHGVLIVSGATVIAAFAGACFGALRLRSPSADERPNLAATTESRR